VSNDRRDATAPPERQVRPQNGHALPLAGAWPPRSAIAAARDAAFRTAGTTLLTGPPEHH